MKPNNVPGRATRPTQRKKTLIIYRTFIPQDVGALHMWVIENKLTIHSDHAVIFYDLVDPEGETSSMGTSQDVTRWGVTAMSENISKEVAKTW